MLTIKYNLSFKTKSSMRITSEHDRTIIQNMVGDNVIEEPLSLDNLVKIINDSNGKILKYVPHDNEVFYYDSMGRYISDDENSTETFHSNQTEQLEPSTNQKMTMGIPVTG